MVRLEWWVSAVFLVVGACNGKSDVGASSLGSSSGDAAAGQGGSTNTGLLPTGGGGGMIFVSGTGGDSVIDASANSGQPASPITVLCAPRDGSADAASSSKTDASRGETKNPDAGDASAPAAWDPACSPPPSMCVDAVTLVYFTNGECLEGRCVWQEHTMTCQEACVDGGCMISFTR